MDDMKMRRRDLRSSTESLIEELKSRGLGVFNLSLPFQYTPKNEETH